ncbi:beta-ketoacyl-[acyl-carrier-protein] synthase I [Pseudoalteromonas sp. 13-15]|jgi:3-oxoacyl-[acyl-carrier-protein] synthase-1|uniref:3-oxoacyl-[acyl-carrier-protein] synthase 1 n=1 Tax=Pseudoalteromonas marina TaxID=267375 RepID=A0ABT9F9W8_9GAMM|nr:MULTISPECIES: beta-ketoacyl-ACP synthase I [Pseudoalteromonas]MBL1383338.1 beta-ketoacyl-ACP synthase I [Colwellia sp.]AUL72229.1 beta-ketoacyl-[acyl-carrier-protein] synthase I [Pseudoalteromonas sp. 13-15]MDA8939140.1 beta-ketoacyl-ACP synthase I [Pseudoalteromonas marina]MDP2484483.1 beta-ketoacyl-ACP synthase I [Pseudoalteromonas marina]MDP2563465.1 beta-ketoacyl-ACP synthase I [Pseudoalteromonas marina]|tara:strand:+ start:5054 stop:6265 length:1212 start_codon:yes stop_codon:yes gene_type:complete
MRRAVITGIGVVSSIGNNKEEVLESLKTGKSGIAFNQEFADYNLRSNVSGKIDINVKDHVDRKAMRFMGDAAAYSYISMTQAIEDSGLSEEQVSNERTGIIVGSGGGSSKWQVEAADILREKGVKRVGPYMVPRTMASTTSACLATPFKIKGVNYSISSACATSAHCIGNAVEQIQLGKQDVVFAGGGEELHWTLAMEFDAMGALSTKYNETPEKASRTYDANRDGFVISGGGGIVVVEELEHALARGAHIYAEIVGYGATSDGYDMVAPSGEGAARCMRQAMQNVDSIDYLNTHGTSTPVGDVKELGAIQDVFGGNSPMISATKAMTGHALGAAGVHEAIFSLLMLEHGFVAPSINVDELDEQAEGLDIVTERKDVELNTVMSNSFGFGGTNATLVMSKYKA